MHERFFSCGLLRGKELEVLDRTCMYGSGGAS